MAKEKIRLDGQSFIGADLSGKLLIYGGGVIPNLAGAHFKGSNFELEGAAGRTLVFLAYLDTASPGIAAKMLQSAKEIMKANAKRLPTN